MQGFASKLTLGAAQNNEDRLALIRQKGQEITQKYEDAKSKTFKAKYCLGKELGQGMHAQVFECFLNTDLEKKTPFAVKISRESDEEKKMAHEKEFEILSKLKHRNIVKSIEFFDDEFKGEIFQVMELIDGEEVLDNIAQQPEGKYTEEVAKEMFK